MLWVEKHTCESEGRHTIDYKVIASVAHRLFEWMFARVNSEDVTDDIRAMYLLGLQKVAC